MAIFDSEKRPRGLRVPSLTAMKAGTAASVSQFSFHRTKSNEQQQQQQQQRTPEEEIAPPVPTISLPAPAPPPTKELPTPPQAPTKELPPRPRITSKVPPRRAVGSNNNTTTSPTNNNSPRPSETSPVSSQGIRQATSPIVSSSPKHDQPLPATPSLGLRQQNPTITTPTLPQPEQEAESPATIKAPQGIRHAEPPVLTPTSPQLSKSLPTPAPEPVQQVQSSLPPTPPVGPQSAESPESPVPVRPAQSLPVQQPPPTQQLPPTPPPVTLSPPPTEDENEALTPLEDFIPTPDGASTPLEQMSSNEQGPPGLNPQLDIEPVAAPLNKVHYACFQEHRNMPVAQNVWCPVPCMTCHKHDQEIRHRCVFCSLRICEGCHRALQKTRNRSLADLMSTLGQ